MNTSGGAHGGNVSNAGASGSNVMSNGGSTASGGSPSNGGSTASGGAAPSAGGSLSGGSPGNGGTLSQAGTSTASGGASAMQGGSAGMDAGRGGTSNSAGGTAGTNTGGAPARGGAGPIDPGTQGDGDFTAGPTYTTPSDVAARGNPVGKSFNFTMSSTNSKYFTGLDPTLNNPRTFTRRIDVYFPAQYKDGAPAPLMVIQDGAGLAFNLIKLALDNLTIDPDPTRRLPAFVAIAVANGGGDGKGSQRGLEYDTMSDRYAKFIDEEVLPAIVANPQIKVAYPMLSFTKDPEGRGAVGCSSGGAAAFTMAWFAPQLFRRVIAYSTTLVDQQDDDAPEERTYPLGAWEYHSGQKLIANHTTQKPVRIFINVNDRDNGYNQPESGHHNWVMANQRTAAALKTKGYHYRYVFGQNAGHCDGGVQRATIGEALRWLWRAYSAP